MTRRLLFIGIPESHARQSIARAQRIGFTVIVADSEEHLRRHAGLVADADRQVVVDYESYDELTALATMLDGEAGLDAIFTFKERSLLPTSRVIADRGLPGNSPACVETCLNKLQTRESLATAGLPGPAFELCHSERDLAAFATRAASIVVAKPLDAQGSVGVTTIAPGADTGAAYRLAAAHGSGAILAEEFVVGPEISVEAGVFAAAPVVFGATEKLLYDGTFVERGQATPHDGPGLTPRACQELLERVVDALGIEFGPIHLELFLSPSGPVVGEVHTRYGGDCIVPLTEHSTGQDMTTPVFAELAGSPMTVRRAPARQHAGIRYLSVAPGRVAGVSGVDEARAIDGVLEVRVDCAPGERVGPPRSSDDRPGYVIAAGPSRVQLERTLTEALDAVRIVVEDAHAGMVGSPPPARGAPRTMLGAGASRAHR